MAEAYYTSTTAIAVTGSVNSGKSTFIGVLTSGKLDDGKGSARDLVAKHQHEKETGNTSAISTGSIIIPENNAALSIIDLCGHENYLHTTTYGLSGYYPDYAFVIVSANKGVLRMTRQHMRILYTLCVPICIIITHIDNAPPDSYKETKQKVMEMLYEFYGKKIQPFFVNDETHFDMVECEFPRIKQEIYIMEQNLSTLSSKIPETECDEIKRDIESIKTKIKEQREYLEKKQNELIQRKNKIYNDVNHSLTKINNSKQLYFPIITISNKTGFFIDVITNIIKNLPPRQIWAPIDDNFIASNKIVNHFCTILKSKNMDKLIKTPKPLDGSIFYVDSCFAPPYVGLVITGINRGGEIKLGDTMYIGPVNNNFVEFHVKNMHNNVKQNIPTIKDHWRGTINMALSKKGEIKRSQIRKGMVAVTSLSSIKNICYKCEAILTFFANSVTIKSGYAPVIHMGTIRQTVSITVDPDKNNGQTTIGFTGKPDCSAIVTMRFIKNPEYVEPYSVFLIRNGSIHGIGMILNTIPLDQDPDIKLDTQKNTNKKS